MNEQEVIDLMKASKSDEEWNANCQKVKEACGGEFPKFWNTAVIFSGLAPKVAVEQKWARGAAARV